jgi:hypothetical protein
MFIKPLAPGIMAHTYNPYPQEAEAGELPVSGQLESKILSNITAKNQNQNKPKLKHM